MNIFKTFFITLSFLSVSSIQAQTIPESLSALIKQYPKKGLSIYIKEVASSEPLVSFQANILRTPASVVKVFTSYAALLALGADYRWPTKIYINEKIDNGMVDGDIYVKGYGNPGLTNEDVEVLSTGLKTKGITEISGDLIVDESYFNTGSQNSAMFDDNPYWPYNALPSAILINHRASAIDVTPDKEHARIDVKKVIPDSSYKIINRLTPHKERCRKSRPGIKIQSDNKNSSITFVGKYSLNCPPRVIYRVLTHPAKMFYATFKHMLAQHNIKFNGKLKIGQVPEKLKPLFSLFSKPLIDIIKSVNKNSNNVMARQTLLTIGAHKFGPPATISKSVEALHLILAANGIKNDRIIIKNGSGLSRSARLSAESLVQLLDHAYKTHDQAWLETLSTMGKDGTLRRRFRKTSLQNNAWMKTGTLANVKSIAGYVAAKTGKMFIVVIMYNNSAVNGGGGTKLQNSIIKWVHNH